MNHLSRHMSSFAAGTLHKDPKFSPIRTIIEGCATNSFVIRQEEREYVLPLGTQITAVGQVSFPSLAHTLSYCFDLRHTLHVVQHGNSGRSQSR